MGKISAQIKQRGFTLIELLIVIALLGALAIGLLATIDPFEQLKKGRDTSARNTTAEFYNANLRYYATKAAFPWGTGTVLNAVPINDPSMQTSITELINAGELKSRFVELAGTGNLAKMYVTSTGPEHEAVCFKPESKSFQVDPVTIFSSDGGSGASCKAQQGGTAACYYCIQ